MRRRPLLTAVLIVLAVLAMVAVAHRPLLRAAGRALVVDEPSRPGDAIVVVAGGTPGREARAAALFQAGGAPQVLVSRQFVPKRVQTLLDLGIRSLDFQGESVAALEKFGVPRSAIVTLDEPVEITETELRRVVAAAKARGWRRVTLVTSAFHARRVRLIWGREAAGAVEAG
ncbi:MAG TPA: YdcF family protein, partial [Methylomirabilota bacterium]|nr:YdcF family protein [Methylomirabilota bacterium]